VLYRIDPNLPDWARGVIDRVAQGIVATSDFAAIQRRLHEFPNRPQQRADFDTGDGDLDREAIRHAV
jgi:hypothetical protein